MNFANAIAKSRKVRKLYHQLELKHHGSEWTIEEDALAFLTDAGLVGRLTMAQQGRWPKEDATGPELEHKLAEWLLSLADQMDIDAERELEAFLAKTEEQLER